MKKNGKGKWDMEPQKSSAAHYLTYIASYGISDAEFKKRIADFSSALAEMSKEGAALDKAIAANLKKLELVK